MTMHYIQTPLIHSHPLSTLTGKSVYLKCESLQTSGSFKDRGIGLLCQYYAKQKARGFVCSSGGNAGLAVAYAARALSLPATIIIPATTPSLMINKLSAEHAEVIVYGDNWNEADQRARALAETKQLAYIPPFDHPQIWKGYESIIEEIQEAGVRPDAIVASVGGGGLYCGLVQGCERLGWNDVPIITAETEGAASFSKSYHTRERIRLDNIATVAVTLGAKQICEQAFRLSFQHPTYPQTVTDKQAVSAALKFADDHRLLVEPACGAALAVAYERFSALEPYQNIVIIVCGGSGTSLELLAQWRHQFT